MSAADPGLRIFIAYRRDDSQGFAGRIYDALVNRFGADAVFRDINDIEPGRPWNEAIDDALASCDAFVLLIGGGWLDAERAGRRRLEDPADRHRREIETAVARNVRIFVALMEHARMPDRTELPEDSSGLRTVPELHAIPIEDHAFEYAIEQLIRGIERTVGPPSGVERDRGAEGGVSRRIVKTPRRYLTLAAVVLAALAAVAALVMLLSSDDADDPTTADAVAGEWSGEARQGSDERFEVQLNIADDCELKEVCGTISVSDVPCFGDLSFHAVAGERYEFSVDHFSGESAESDCTPGAGEYLTPHGDDALLYTTGYDSTIRGVLHPLR